MSGDNIYLGAFTLEGLPKESKAGAVKIEVSFDIDVSRTLQVSAVEHQTGNRLAARITSDWLSKVNFEDLATTKIPVGAAADGNVEMVETFMQSNIKIWTPKQEEGAAAMDETA